MKALTPHGHLVAVAEQLGDLAARPDVPVRQLVAGVADYTARIVEVVGHRVLLENVDGPVALGRIVAAALNPSTETADGVAPTERLTRHVLRRVVTALLDLLDGDVGAVAGLTDLVALLAVELDAAVDEPAPARQVEVRADDVLIVSTTTAAVPA
jgi:hypothetical protein